MSDGRGNLPGGTPQELGAIDWITYRYRELNADDLFWFEQNPNGAKNPAFRKIDDNTALSLKDQRRITIDPNINVHQKEY